MEESRRRRTFNIRISTRAERILGRSSSNRSSRDSKDKNLVHKLDWKLEYKAKAD